MSRNDSSGGTEPLRAFYRQPSFLFLDKTTLLVGDGTSILRDAKLRLKELVATFPAV